MSTRKSLIISYRIFETVEDGSDEFASEGIGNLRGLAGRYVQFARDVVGADEWQSRLSKMGMKKSRLASTV